MVFVPFTGINHHNRCITFAAGLLSDESVGAYQWLLEQFKKAFGTDPQVVITDQDPSIKIVVPEYFPNTIHRFCMWHIMQKLVTKVCSHLSVVKHYCPSLPFFGFVSRARFKRLSDQHGKLFWFLKVSITVYLFFSN